MEVLKRISRGVGRFLFVCFVLFGLPGSCVLAGVYSDTSIIARTYLGAWMLLPFVWLIWDLGRD